MSAIEALYRDELAGYGMSLLEGVSCPSFSSLQER